MCPSSVASVGGATTGRRCIDIAGTPSSMGPWVSCVNAPASDRLVARLKATSGDPRHRHGGLGNRRTSGPVGCWCGYPQHLRGAGNTAAIVRRSGRSIRRSPLIARAAGPTDEILETGGGGLQCHQPTPLPPRGGALPGGDEEVQGGEEGGGQERRRRGDVVTGRKLPPPEAVQNLAVSDPRLAEAMARVPPLPRIPRRPAGGHPLPRLARAVI